MEEVKVVEKAGCFINDRYNKKRHGRLLWKSKDEYA